MPLSAAPQTPKDDQGWIFLHSEKIVFVVRRNKKKNYQDEDKKSTINKKINPQIKKPHLKRIPNKDNPISFSSTNNNNRTRCYH